MTKFKILTIASFILVFAASCTVQKRTHRSGYYIDWHKKSTNVVAEKTGAKKDFVASTDDEINLPKKEEVNFSSQPAVECEDTLILLTGEKIICSVLEIGEEDVFFEECNVSESKKQSIPTSKIKKICYANGGYENINNIDELPLFKHKLEFVQSQNNNGNCQDTIFIASRKIIVCKIVGISKSEIRYKKCTDTSGNFYTIERYKLNGNINAILTPQSGEPNSNVNKPTNNNSRKRQYNCLDTLYLKDGNFIVCKIVSVHKNEIIYKMCGDSNDNNHSISKSVLRKRVTYSAAIVSFVCGVLGIIGFLLYVNQAILILSIFLILFAVLLGIVSLSKILSNKHKYKGSVFAIFAILSPLIAIALWVGLVSAGYIAFW